MSASLQPSAFSAASKRVVRWVVVRRWIALLGRTGWLATAVLAVVCAVIGFGSATMSARLSIPPGLFVIWLAGAWVFAWLRRPGAYSAFALWDQAAGRHEAFANAWWFDQLADKTAPQAEHIAAQLPILTEARHRLTRDLPVRWAKSAFAVPAVTLLAVIVSWWAGPRTAREFLDERQQQIARESAARMASPEWQKKNLARLAAPAKQELEKLKENIQKTAKDLQSSGNKDARQVLSSLENRARDAEKLTERIGGDGDSWASAEMIRELRRHADTADLGDAVAERNPAEAAKAADDLANQLKSPLLAAETRDRMKETLKEVQKQSAKEDRQRTVGENVLAAADRMNESKPADAAGEFEKLADKMREIARREQTRKELEKLAQQLRDTASSIAGQSAGGMQQMAPAGQQSGSGPSGQAPRVSQSGQQGQSPGAPLTPPGLGQNQPEQMNQLPMQGSGSSQQLPMMIGRQPGKGQSGQGKPMLLAPIPGAKPNEQPSALLLGSQLPKGTPDRSIAIAAPGGNQPGAGKADLNNKPTDPQKSGAQGMVAAQQTNEGQSAIRSVEGGTRKEAAARSASEMAVEFIQAEEQALDEAALPPSRREQVRRYFTELRKRFEKQD